MGSSSSKPSTSTTNTSSNMSQQQNSNNEQEEKQHVEPLTKNAVKRMRKTVEPNVPSDVNVQSSSQQHAIPTLHAVVDETIPVSNTTTALDPTLPTIHPFIMTNGKIKFQCRNLLLHSKCQTYHLHDETNFQLGVTLCQRISGTILELELKTRNFELTTPNFYNSRINEIHPVVYQITNRFEYLFYNPIGDCYLEMKPDETVNIPVILTDFNKKFFFDIQLKVDETGIIDANIESTIPFGHPNATCQLHFSQIATAKTDANLFE